MRLCHVLLDLVLHALNRIRSTPQFVRPIACCLQVRESKQYSDFVTHLCARCTVSHQFDHSTAQALASAAAPPAIAFRWAPHLAIIYLHVSALIKQIMFALLSSYTC